jgi:acetyl-CoA carboxylase carboxyl transferase subunit beta
LEITVDPDSFEEWDADLPLCDPLEFPKYRGKLEKAQQKTGLQDAVITGKAELAGMEVAIGVMESGFRGGSMGWVVGERITRLIERAAEEKLPLIIVSASGGARMEESLVSLMQMAKTAGATAKLAEAGVPYISMLTHPTYGGVMASYAFLGDIIVAEPGAAMGFAGPRVIEVTGMPMGEGVQTAEYQRQHGMLDLVVPREDMRETLATMIAWSSGSPRGTSGGLDEEQDALRTEPTERGEGEEAAAWERVQLARHPDRPYSLDYIEEFVDGFVELHGDRRFGDDGAIVSGIGWIDERPVAIIGHQKGRQARERSRRNFAMAKPEGYRKAMRIMRIASQVGRPIVTLIDTPGAHCLEESEARGVSEAIASNQRDMFSLPVPIVPVVIGEGGSGGAIGIGVGDRVLMLENSYYSVIAPESCAAILWRNRALKEEAADALRLTSDDALRLGIIDGIVSEPEGGAHDDPKAAADLLRRALTRTLRDLEEIDWGDLPRLRYEKFRKMGQPGNVSNESNEGNVSDEG